MYISAPSSYSSTTVAVSRLPLYFNGSSFSYEHVLSNARVILEIERVAIVGVLDLSRS